MKIGQNAIENTKRTFCDRLKEARENAGYTQAQLAERCNEVTAMTIHRWERGETEPSIIYLSMLCNLLHVKADWLLGLTEIKPYETKRYDSVMAKLKAIVEEGE